MNPAKLPAGDSRMKRPANPLRRALESGGVVLPDGPIDLSPVFSAAGISRRYVIGMTGRCGSTWLATALQQIPNCGNPQEFMSDEFTPFALKSTSARDLPGYYQSVFTRFKTGETFGFKIDGMRLGWLSSLCDVERSFGGGSTQWIDMRRLNIVQQAFSFARAKKSGVWHLFTRKDPKATQIKQLQQGTSVADADVWSEIFRLCEAERTLDRLYRDAKVEPLRIVYEELRDSKPQLLLRVLAHVFPERSFAPEVIRVVDGTLKVSSEANEIEETAFCARFSRQINAVYQMRAESDATVEDMRKLRGLVEQM